MKKEKISLHKIYNKLFWSNCAYGYGMIMFIFALIKKNPANDSFIGNILLCSLIIAFSITGIVLCFYFAFCRTKKIKSKNWLIASASTSWIPFVGALVGFFWKIFEKKQHEKDGLIHKSKFPTSYTILFFITLFVILAIWLYYIINGEIQYTDPRDPTKTITGIIPGIFDVILAPIKGFGNAVQLIVYLLVLGAFLQVVNSSKSLEAGISVLTKKLKHKEVILIPIIMIIFSVGGTTFGMCEETLGFYMIIIPVMLAAGFDTFTALLVICFGAGLGVCGSTLNPFAILTAINASNPPPPADPIVLITDGMVWRFVSYIALVTLGISFTIWYALRIKKNPSKSVVYEMRNEHNNSFVFSDERIPSLNWRRKLTLVIFAFSYLFMFIAIVDWETITGWNGFIDFHEWLAHVFPFLSSASALGNWYLQDMSFLFFTSTFAIGMLFWHSEKNFLNNVFTGMKDFISVAIVLALANGISVVLANSGLQFILIDKLGSLINAISNPQAIILILFFMFIPIAFAIPSTSGFATTVFPIVGPALKASGAISVSSGITAFSFASGLINMAAPTAAALMSGCALSKIPVNKFYKGALPLILMLFVLMIVLLLVGTVLPDKLF